MTIRRPAVFACVALYALSSAPAAQTQTTGSQSQSQSQGQTTAPPKPRPFPGAIVPPPATGQSDDPAAKKPTTPQAPTVAELGAATIYPSAELLDSIDAGRGQKILIYGTNMPYDQIVTYYRAQIRSNRELFEAPPMHQFDLGRYDANAMAFPPSIVVKDYSWNNSEGYLHIQGTTSKRYRTIIQVIPVQPGDGR